MLTSLSTRDWNYQSAAHLLNRAGFGGTPEEIEAARAAGLDATVERLLHPPEEPAAPSDSPAPSWTQPKDVREVRGELHRLRKNRAENRPQLRAMVQERRDELLDLRLWWLGRMRAGPAPLREKMTLFWHGHFATSVQKVRETYWMWRQNEMFRQHAFGNFRELLGEVSRDPAMMIYLDLVRSRKLHPNENWARELMELFTLGLGQYTEEDVRESARAFTGYRIDLASEQFRFERRLQDTGRKTFLGQTGNFTGDDILDLIVAQPACARFIGRKIWRFFAEDEPPAPIVEAVTGALRENRFELQPVLREIFRSAEFHAPRVVRAQIKSPIQFIIQTCRLLETDLPPASVTQLALQQMGQMPFAPPNVKGWDGGKSWISTATLLFRYNFADYLLNGTGDNPNAPEAVRRAPTDLRRIIPEELRAKPAELLAHLARRLCQTQPNERQTHTFLAYLQTRAPDRSDQTMRRLLHLMMSTPQYQLT
ncbi:MAG TPA: DUF1800 domain-containing protein [Chthoniobacterales bacterium]|jgi:uncharacterized protein (DUF1800 family)